jgi:hypothetical protein
VVLQLDGGAERGDGQEAGGEQHHQQLGPRHCWFPAIVTSSSMDRSMGCVCGSPRSRSHIYGMRRPELTACACTVGHA